MKADLSYRRSGMFVDFYPNTPQGQKAWNELHAQNGGSASVMFIHAPAVIASLKSAGYTVRKAIESKKPTDDDALLSQLGL